MEKKILVAYASKYGATAEIAEKIGETLRQAGLQTDVTSVEQVNDLTPYDAVILGSAVYIGKWRKEAGKFLEENEKALAKRPLWLFSSGPSGDGDPVELLNGWRLPAAQQPIVERIQPRDTAVFHGYVNKESLNFIEKWMLNKVEAPVGDFRDWDGITSWANGIAAALK